LRPAVTCSRRFETQTDAASLEEEEHSMSISQAQLVQELMDVLDETFESHHGIYLDKNTSLFETLEQITHEQASRPIGGKCATLAAQVAHITFYLAVLERLFMANANHPADGEELRRYCIDSLSEPW